MDKSKVLKAFGLMLFVAGLASATDTSSFNGTLIGQTITEIAPIIVAVGVIVVSLVGLVINLLILHLVRGIVGSITKGIDRAIGGSV